jgi:hypothetical protein
MLTWDLDVYPPGCMERLESPFFWRDLLWKLDESELLAQAKSWNVALQQCCDDVRLEGDDTRRRQAPGQPVRPLRAGEMRRLRAGREGVPAMLQVQNDHLVRTRLSKEGRAAHRKCCIE